VLRFGVTIDLSPKTEAFLLKLAGMLKPQPAPGPITKGQFTIMSRFKLPDDQPDFEILVAVSGKDSEGQPADVAGVTLVVDNSNAGAIEGTLKSSTPSADGKTLNCVVGAHVGSPSADLGVIGYKAMDSGGNLIGAGSDEFLIGTGALKVADIQSTVPFPAEPPPATA